jgi:hypothetical protein
MLTPKQLFGIPKLKLLGCCLALMFLSISFGCTQTNKPRAEAAPVVPPAAAEPATVASNNLPPPEPNAVREAVKRVLKDAVIIDDARNPNFVAGDFNGDLSQDIAIVIKPQPQKLDELNEEFPPFILRDPVGGGEVRSPRLRIANDDVLLAIIHGYGANGWRDPQATQTYILKNAVGSGIESKTSKEFVSANAGKKMPPVRGDVVRETIQDKHGYLYYADATYAWYDPLTYTEPPPPRRGHGAQQMKP